MSADTEKFGSMSPELLIGEKGRRSFVATCGPSMKFFGYEL
jgi:hypothetical protein